MTSDPDAYNPTTAAFTGEAEATGDEAKDKSPEGNVLADVAKDAPDRAEADVRPGEFIDTPANEPGDGGRPTGS